MSALTAGLRRQWLLEMRLADDAWPHRPIDPDLCMVSDDMVAIVQHLLTEQPAPSSPITIATPTPGANEHGWHNEDVVVTLTGTAGPGRQISHIEFSLAGAEVAGACRTIGADRLLTD